MLLNVLRVCDITDEDVQLQYCCYIFTDGLLRK